MMNLFVLQLLNGVQLGVLLFLIAAGLTLVFGIMDVINLAHGVLYMVGAYLIATFATATGSFWWGLLLTLPAAVVVGLVIEFVVMRRLYARSHLDQVLATFGLVMIANEAVKMIWGTSPLSVPMPEIFSGSVPLMGPLKYPVYRIAIIVAGLAVALGLFIMVNYTRVGMLLRAGATNRDTVSALGVDINRLFAIVFTVGLSCGRACRADPFGRHRHGGKRSDSDFCGCGDRRHRFNQGGLSRRAIGGHRRYFGWCLRADPAAFGP